jgi:predicted esterase
MTREDRASEIQDQAVYLNQLLDVVLAQPGYTAGTRLVLFGFSQGVATAWRWFSQGRIVPHHLVLWAGSIPPEPIHHKPMPHTLVAWGDSDPFLPIDQVPDKLQALDALGLSYQPLPYRGGHTLPPDALRALQEKL